MLAAATQAYSQSTSGSCDGATGSSHSSAPLVDTNQIWYETVDGKEKMLVYGVGSSTSSFYSHRRPDYEAPSSGPFSNLFSTMEDFQDAMRNAIHYQLADTERRMIDYEDDRDELRLRFDWLTKNCQEGGLQFNLDDLPRIVRRNAPATASTPASTAAPVATAQQTALPQYPTSHHTDQIHLSITMMTLGWMIECITHFFFFMSYTWIWEFMFLFSLDLFTIYMQYIY